MFVILILHALILQCGDNIEILPNPRPTARIWAGIHKYKASMIGEWDRRSVR